MEETPMLEAFLEVDKQLLPSDSCAHVRQTQKHHKPATLDSLMNANCMFYLSDGGYSRLYVRLNDDGCRVVLGSESTTDVKNRWKLPEVQKAVRALEAVLDAELKSLDS